MTLIQHLIARLCPELATTPTAMPAARQIAKSLDVPPPALAGAAAQAQPQADPISDRLTQIVREAMGQQPDPSSGFALLDKYRSRDRARPGVGFDASTAPASQGAANLQGETYGREETGHGQQGQGWPQGLLTEPVGGGVSGSTTTAPSTPPIQDGGAAAAAIEAAAHEAATSPRNNLPEPTDAQKEAGNYKKGHTTWNGLRVTIENPSGSERRGVDPRGKQWSVKMPAHYGYVKRSEGADGEQVDIYMGPNPGSNRVFVVDQVEARTGEFDEHKAVTGVDTLEQAMQLYDAGFSDGKGPQRRGAVTEMTVDEFKAWVHDVAEKGEKTADELHRHMTVGKPRGGE